LRSKHVRTPIINAGRRVLFRESNQCSDQTCIQQQQQQQAPFAGNPAFVSEGNLKPSAVDKENGNENGTFLSLLVFLFVYSGPIFRISLLAPFVQEPLDLQGTTERATTTIATTSDKTTIGSFKTLSKGIGPRIPFVSWGTGAA